MRECLRTALTVTLCILYVRLGEDGVCDLARRDLGLGGTTGGVAHWRLGGTAGGGGLELTEDLRDCECEATAPIGILCCGDCRASGVMELSLLQEPLPALKKGDTSGGAEQLPL